MTPYYDDGGIVIYHGDCRDIMPNLRCDAAITDPPYGIGFKYASHDDSERFWFPLMNQVVPALRRVASFVVMPSCAIKRLPWWYANHEPDWVIAWYKGSPGHQAHVGFNDWEPLLVWGKPYRPMHDHFHTPCGFDKSGHPCPKPVAWAAWLVSRAAPPSGLIIDPFAGSGTTLRAAKDLGRCAIGIEIEERYCEIAAERLSQGVLDLGGAA